MEEREAKDSCSYAADKTDKSFTSDVVEDIDSAGFVEETLSNSDNLEVESGVESATGDVNEAELLDYFALSDGSFLLADLDLTTEQAQETLKYFSEYSFSIYCFNGYKCRILQDETSCSLVLRNKLALYM